MTSSATQQRPPQVTLAGWMIIVGSVLVVVTVFELVQGLRSLETRDAVEGFLAEPPGNTLDWGVETVLQFLRVSAMVTAGCATAAAVLGWHALKRNRGARVGLTVLAVPLFLTGIVTGGFMSSLVAAASLLLWLQPARDWFNGKPWTPPERPARRHEADRDAGGDPAPWVSPRPPAADDAAEPRPVQGFGDRPSWEAPESPTAPAAPDQLPDPYRGQQLAPWGPQAAPAPGSRPDVVLVAALITWIFAGFTLFSSLASMLVLAASPDLLMEEVERQQPQLAAEGITETTLLVSTLVMGGLVVLWSLAAVVAAALLMRGKAWAGTLLLVLAIGAAVGCFVAALVAPLMALPVLAAVTVAVLLRRPDVRGWLAARQSSR